MKDIIIMTNEQKIEYILQDTDFLDNYLEVEHKQDFIYWAQKEPYSTTGEYLILMYEDVRGGKYD